MTKDELDNYRDGVKHRDFYIFLNESDSLSFFYVAIQGESGSWFSPTSEFSLSKFSRTQLGNKHIPIFATPGQAREFVEIMYLTSFSDYIA